MGTTIIFHERSEQSKGSEKKKVSKKAIKFSPKYYGLSENFGNLA